MAFTKSVIPLLNNSNNKHSRSFSIKERNQLLGLNQLEH